MPNPSKLGPGSHVCAISQSFAEQQEVLLPFIEEGLASAEYCLFMMPESRMDDWLSALRSRGIVPGSQPGGGHLEIEGPRRDGWSHVNSISRARHMLPIYQRAISNFGGMWIAVDEARYLENGTPLDNLCH
jgi:MEDS: MEthanogen/methylotroph, DcmR Sensory domain